jgi:hypothetical protein
LTAPGCEHVLAIEGDGTGSGLYEAENHAPQSGLAAARFADQAKRFSLSNVERDTVDRADLALGLAEHAFVSLVDLDEVKDGEQGHGMIIQGMLRL